MELLIFLVLILFIIFPIVKGIIKGLGYSEPKSHKNESLIPKIELSISTASSSYSDVPDTGPLTCGNKGWILNPRSPFVLTVYGIDHGTANELKNLLDKGYSLGTYDLARAILPIVCNSNFRCKEIEEYIMKFKPQYLHQIEKMKESSIEWKEATDNDREDLLCDFRQKAIESLEMRPYCDLEILFENRPANGFLNGLIEQFGFETLQLYLKYSDKIGKVNIISADHYYRSGFEKNGRIGLSKKR